MTLLKQLRDTWQGKAPLTAKRSSKWSSVRKAHLEEHPTCAVCGGTKKLEVHHIIPFHENPSLELDPHNLITLCESASKGILCHMFIGHLGNYRTVNPSAVADAASWNKKLRGE